MFVDQQATWVLYSISHRSGVAVGIKRASCILTRDACIWLKQIFKFITRTLPVTVPHFLENRLRQIVLCLFEKKAAGHYIYTISKDSTQHVTGLIYANESQKESIGGPVVELLTLNKNVASSSLVLRSLFLPSAHNCLEIV